MAVRFPASASQKRTFRSWQAVATRYHQRLEERIGKVDRRSIAFSLTHGATDRAEIARRVLAWVQDHVRYTGLQLGEVSACDTF